MHHDRDIVELLYVPTLFFFLKQDIRRCNIFIIFVALIFGTLPILLSYQQVIVLMLLIVSILILLLITMLLMLLIFLTDFQIF